MSDAPPAIVRSTNGTFHLGNHQGVECNRKTTYHRIAIARDWPLPTDLEHAGRYGFCKKCFPNGMPSDGELRLIYHRLAEHLRQWGHDCFSHRFIIDWAERHPPLTDGHATLADDSPDAMMAGATGGPQ